MTSSPAPAPLPASNPLASPSQLPHQLPPFAEITAEHVREALLAGMAEQRAEVAAIVADPAEPTFENTVVALERSGQLLSRAEHVFHNTSSAVSDAWSLQHPALYTVLWTVVILAVFVPLSVRAYLRTASR